MQKTKLRCTLASTIASISILLSSCVTTQKAIYFDNIQNKEFTERDVVPIIQKNDLLSITVSSLNPEASAVFNIPTQVGSANNSQITGYLVNTEGTFLFPILGIMSCTLTA